jgi:hypothetical protein
MGRNRRSGHTEVGALRLAERPTLSSQEDLSEVKTGK